jgi:hypothetical protein
MSLNPPKPPAGPPGAAAREAAEDAAAGVVLLALVGSDRIAYAPWTSLKRSSAACRRVLVRVVLARELAVGLLDLVVRGLLVDAERLVGVLHRGHRQPETTTRAGRRTLPLER